MAKPLNQNQVLNYLADLPLLLSQARTFLDLKNRQGRETDFSQIDQLLRVYALNLTLVSLEEFESLSFEKVFERLEWLFEQEKLIEGGSVPVNLEELGAQLQEKEKKTTKETKQRREVENLVADLEKRAKLLAALKKAQIETKTEASPDWKTIVGSLPENEELANDIQKTLANPELLRWKKEELAQESWERFLRQSLPNITLEEIKNPLSLESLELVAGQIKKPPEEREILIEHLTKISRSLTPEQAASLKESLIANLVALSPLARDLGWEWAAKSAAWQIKDQFKEIPLEQIYLFARQFAQESERVIPAESLPTEASIFSPLAIKIGEEMVPFAATQEIPGNPSGNAWLVKDKDNQPFPYHLTIRGVPPAELEKLAKIQQMISGDPRSPSSQFLSQWAIKLRQFQAQYFSQEAIIWQTNRIRAIFNASRVLTPLSKISQQAKAWFFQTSIGQSIKLWLAKTSQKSLEALWTTAKTGIKAAVTKGITAFLTRIGLQAVANTVAPVIGGIIAFVGEKVIRGGFSLAKRAGSFLLSGFGLTNVLMEGITGQREVKDTSRIGKLAMVGVAGPIALVAILTLFDNSLVKNSALLGGGGGIGIEENKYLSVSKTVNPETVANSQLPTTLVYTITITAKEGKLTNIKLADTITLVSEKKTSKSKLTRNPSIPSTIAEIDSGQTKTITYSVNLTQEFENTSILNELDIEATVEGITDTQRVETSAVVTVGQPTSCFAFEGSWTSSDQALAMGAIAKISAYQKYYNSLCQNSVIPIILVREPGNAWCSIDQNGPNKVYITNKCLGNAENALYSFAHEIGHIYAHRNNDVYVRFNQMLYSSNPLIQKERPLCSYPLLQDLTPSYIPGEDLPETVSVYIMNQEYPNHVYHNCGGPINLTRDYPLHYNFIRELFE